MSAFIVVSGMLCAKVLLICGSLLSVVKMTCMRNCAKLGSKTSVRNKGKRAFVTKTIKHYGNRVFRHLWSFVSIKTATN